MLAIAAALAVAPVDPLHERHIAADSTTLVHIDFGHAAATALGRRLLAEIEASDSDLSEFTTDLGIDFGDEIRSMTIYTRSAGVGATAQGGDVSLHVGGDEGTVFLIYGDDALERWDEALAAEQEGESPGEIAGREVRTISDGEQAFLGVMLPEVQGRMWVLAPSLDALERAVGVVEGDERANLDDWPVAGPVEGAFVYVAVRDFEQLKHWEPASDVAQRAKGFSLSLGQHEDSGFARMQITVDNPEDAEAVVGVCQGVIGLARLMLSDEADMRPLLSLLGDVNIETNGRLIEASLVGDADHLCDTLDQLAETEDADEVDETEEIDEIDEDDEDEDEEDEDEPTDDDGSRGREVGRV